MMLRCLLFFFFFFFSSRRRHTRLVSDWSSDVCSSDLTATLEEVTIHGTESGSVFRNRKGAPYRSFRTAFERAVRKALILDFTFHDLRHTFASRLVMSGVDLPTVKDLMGHKNINMTLRYSHLSSEH